MKFREIITGHDYDRIGAVDRILDPVTVGESGQLERLEEKLTTLAEVFGRFLLMNGITPEQLNGLAGFERFEVVE